MTSCRPSGLVNRLAPVAEEMNHHPDLEISWNKVTVTLTSHSEGGLTENDFVLAGKIDGWHRTTVRTGPARCFRHGPPATLAPSPMSDDELPRSSRRRAPLPGPGASQ